MAIGFTGEHETKFSTNHPSVLLNKDLVSTKTQTELSLGRIGGPLDRPPCPGFRMSPLGLVPKKEPGKFRLIHDLSYPKFQLGQSVNSNIEGEYSVVSYDDLDFAIYIIQHYGQGAQVAKMDIESAYRIIPIHPTDFKLLGFTWEGKYYFDRCMNCSLWIALPLVKSPKPLVQHFSGLPWTSSIFLLCPTSWTISCFSAHLIHLSVLNT